ncbi:MAG: hypothetical protein EA370_12345 [Wenzhouxiangella sp.]|nr:MAG: hypothetical protein EA370_12345 [Wenzhouxiangella sp.]
MVRMNEFALLLDLEGTVIESWGRPGWLGGQIEAIGNLARSRAAEGPVKLGLMSWAVLDDSELGEFRSRLAGPLEQRLGFRFDPRLTRSMNQWAELVHRDSWPLFAPATVFQVFDKPSILFWLRGAARSLLPDSVILVDDDLPHGDTIHCQGRVIQLINVHELTAQEAS